MQRKRRTMSMSIYRFLYPGTRCVTAVLCRTRASRAAKIRANASTVLSATSSQLSFTSEHPQPAPTWMSSLRSLILSYWIMCTQQYCLHHRPAPASSGVTRPLLFISPFHQVRPLFRASGCATTYFDRPSASSSLLGLSNKLMFEVDLTC
jgi:hypothetical protein